MRQIGIIGLLTLVIAIIGVIYIRTWESKKKVKAFLKEEKEELKDNKKEQTLKKSDEINNLKEKPKENIKKIEIISKTSFNNLKPNKTFKTKYKITSKPFIVKTHRNKRYHILIQDEKYNIYFIDETGKLIWKKPFGEKIITDIFEIDYLRNGKKQYLFATTKYLYLIDYNGNRVGNFPYELNVLQKPEFLNVIDYSKNRNYRIAITSKEGNIYLFDKYLKILQGWNPKSFESPLKEKLIHMRVSKKDYLCIAKESGEILLIKRNGKIYENYPIKLNKTIKSFMPLKRNNKENSSLVVLTSKNILYEFDLNGKIKLELKPLISNEEANLFMIKDELKYNNYVLLKKSPKEIKILDNQAKVLLKDKINLNDEVEVKFYNSNKNIFVINNKSQNKLNLYIENKSLIKKPIKANSLFNLIYTKRSSSIKIFNCIDNILETYHINLT